MRQPRQTSRLLVCALALLMLHLFSGVALAQSSSGSDGLDADPSAMEGVDGSKSSAVDLTNPISVLRNAGRVFEERNDLLGSIRDGRVNVDEGIPGEPLQAGSDPDDYSGRRGAFSTTLSILMLLTVLTLAPSVLILCTSFTRIVVVLALLRQAIGTQTLPPSQVIIGLSLFLTLLVMAPTLNEIHQKAVIPLMNEEINEMEAWEIGKQPIRRFMFDQIDYAGNWNDVYLMLEYRGVDTSDPSKLTEDDVDMLTLVPAFILSELKIAFLMGFRLYLPFLVIDMVISSVLISMGMLMLPPVLISLPFKLLLFVLVDGWRLVTGNLLSSFAVPGVTT